MGCLFFIVSTCFSGANAVLEAKCASQTTMGTYTQEPETSMQHYNLSGVMGKRHKTTSFLTALALLSATVAVGFMNVHCYMSLRPYSLGKINGPRGRSLSVGGKFPCSQDEQDEQDEQDSENMLGPDERRKKKKIVLIIAGAAAATATDADRFMDLFTDMMKEREREERTKLNAASKDADRLEASIDNYKNNILGDFDFDLRSNPGQTLDTYGDYIRKRNTVDGFQI